jgi:hypothetical protein
MEPGNVWGGSASLGLRLALPRISVSGSACSGPNEVMHVRRVASTHRVGSHETSTITDRTSPQRPACSGRTSSEVEVRETNAVNIQISQKWSDRIA